MATVTQATITSWLKDRPEQGNRHIHRVVGGLDLCIYATGPASWSWRGRPRGLHPSGKRWPLQRIKVGDTSTTTLAAAVAAAAKLKAEIAAGGDPAGDRRRAVTARSAARAAEAAKATCRELVGLYAASMAARDATPAHMQDEIGQVTRGLDAVAVLDLPIEAVTFEAIEALLRHCPAKSRATRFAALHRFLTWTSRRAGGGTVPATTMFARHERPKRGEPRQRVLTLDELKAIWFAASELGGVDGDLTRFLICVPCRRGEAGLMTWRDVDLGSGVWTQPTSKNDLAHRFYLGSLALDVLQSRKRDAGLAPEDAALVFSGISTGRIFTTWSHLKRRLDARLMQRGENLDAWTLHDLRRSFATLVAERFGADDGLVDLILNHAASKTRSKITKIYNLSERREDRVRLMRSWDRLLVSLISGAGEPEAEIVPLHVRTA